MWASKEKGLLEIYFQTKKETDMLCPVKGGPKTDTYETVYFHLTWEKFF